MQDKIMCIQICLIHLPYIPFCDPGRFGGRTTLYFLLLYLKVYPLSVSISQSVCLSLSLHFFPVFCFLSSYLLICTRQSNDIFLRCLSAISPENHSFPFLLQLSILYLVLCGILCTYLCLFVGCIVCPFACSLVVLYWPWTLNLLCLYVHIQR